MYALLRVFNYDGFVFVFVDVQHWRKYVWLYSEKIEKIWGSLHVRWVWGIWVPIVMIKTMWVNEHWTRGARVAVYFLVRVVSSLLVVQSLSLAVRSAEQSSMYIVAVPNLSWEFKAQPNSSTTHSPTISPSSASTQTSSKTPSYHNISPKPPCPSVTP